MEGKSLPRKNKKKRRGKWVRRKNQKKMAEKEGFEPSRQSSRLHAFQACAFNRSAISPRSATNDYIIFQKEVNQPPYLEFVLKHAKMFQNAKVAELVDALGSGPSEG